MLNVKTNLYLHITKNKVQEIEEQERLKPESWRPPDPDRREQPNTFVRRQEVNVSTTMSRFQVLPFTQVTDDKFSKFIKGGSVVRLQHTELGGYLTSDDLDFTDDGLAEVYVRCDKIESESKSTSDLFEIEIADNIDRG